MGHLFATELPGRFHRFSAAAALSTFGLMTFGLFGYHFVKVGLVPVSAVPLVYAGAMALEAVAALATGAVFDQVGRRVVLVVPLLTALVPWWVFSDRLPVALLGLGCWALATGVLDSTVKAYVADLVAPARRATAYGVFAALQGMGALVGGALAGVLLADHLGALTAVIVAAQVGALVLMVSTMIREPAQP